MVIHVATSAKRNVVETFQKIVVVSGTQTRRVWIGVTRVTIAVIAGTLCVVLDARTVGITKMMMMNERCVQRVRKKSGVKETIAAVNTGIWTK